MKQEKGLRIKPIKDFFTSGSAGGIVLLCCVVISLIIANSPFYDTFQKLLATELGFNTASVHLKYSLSLWINDGLMAIFFLMVGLEIKRELVSGALSSPKKAAFPIFAAIGGVLFPALIYFFFNKEQETAIGWGVPMATDIAFAIAVITILGKQVPLSLRIFLTALAIVDDLIAILIIAIFYTSEIQYSNLIYAGLIWLLLLLFNKFGLKKLYFYIIPGVFIWYFIHHSGIHATIAGVLTAFTLPTSASNGKESPLEKLEHLLHAPVNFIIMPLFALVNTNIHFQSGMIDELFTPLGYGIILGLIIGKPVGITLFAWISKKIGWARLPDGTSWVHIIGAGLLGGIGFTMSIFIAILAFSNHAHLLAESKFAILCGSLFAGILGTICLKMASSNIKRNRT